MKCDENEVKLNLNKSLAESKVFDFQRNDSTSVFYYTDLSCKRITSTVDL